MALSAKARKAVIVAATLVGVAVAANLGAWQLRRAAQKIALQDALESRAKLSALTASELARTPAALEPQQHRAVRLRGQWLPQRNVFLENRQMNGRVGFYLVTPLQLEGRPEAVLVQRGWVPRDLRDRTLLPAIATPAGMVDVEGRIAPPPARLYEFAPSPVGLIRQNLDLGDYTRETGLPLAPLSVLQADSPSTAGDGLLRDWPHPAVDVQKHYGYAF
ncbi:MAG: SURF1 family protein, partial [Rhizobiales bacterium]|nr:SURF1 family protein [Rhizobacter sp.]